MTFLSGVEAAGKVFAIGILFRPVALLTTGCVRAIRPKLAQYLAARRHRHVTRIVLGASGAALALHALVTLGIFVAWPWIDELIFSGRQGAAPLLLGSWATAYALMVVRNIVSSALQAGHAFRPLSLAMMAGAVVTVTGSLALVAAFGPAYSIIGMVLGEAVSGGLILWRFRRMCRPVPSVADAALHPSLAERKAAP